MSLDRFDALAFRYVSYIAVPTLTAYTGYSLMKEKHKGWYSFILSTLTSFIYMFGFVQLVPQLIINYKLKVRDSNLNGVGSRPECPCYRAWRTCL